MKKLAKNFISTGDPLSLEHQTRARSLGEFRERLLAESERALGSSILVEGKSTRFAVRAGATITVEDSGTFKLPQPVGELGVVRVTHTWDGVHYANEFVASPWEHFTSPEARARRVINGIVTGECVDIEDPDRLGRVRVRLHFQDADAALPWVRMVAPYAGNGRGIQFFPEVGDEVVIAFEQGDPARPYVIGAVWNGKDEPPDLEYKQIVTRAGNTVRISDDARRGESIQIFTPRGDCMVQLENASGGPLVTIHSEGDISLEAKEELRIKCRNLVQEVEQSYTRKAGASEKAAAAADMTLTAGSVSVAADMNMALSANVNLDASAGAMHNIVGALVHLNPPVFVKLPVSAARPMLKASAWTGQDVPPPQNGLANTVDAAPPRAIPAASKAAEERTAAAKLDTAAPVKAGDEAADTPTTFIEIEMVDEAGDPVPGLAFVVELPDGTSRPGVLDDRGRARLDDIEPGECTITFPDLDKDAWTGA